MKTKNPGARRQGFDIGMVVEAVSNSEATAPAPFNQPSFDVVALLARRSRVHPISVRAQLDAFNIGGRS